MAAVGAMQLMITDGVHTARVAGTPRRAELPVTQAVGTGLQVALLREA
jgi:hypothetical protein